MKVDILASSGFCGGVTRALYILDKTIKENSNSSIYLLGQIVHNKSVIEKYNNLGVKTVSLNDLDKLKDEDIVVISAHGLSDTDREKLKRFKTVDTTCAYVKLNQDLIKKEDSKMIFIGKKNHSETIALTKDNKNVTLVENIDDLNGFKDNDYGIIINQTTFNIHLLNYLRKIAKEKAPNYQILDTMCSVSKNLQTFISDKNSKYNVCLIVGDKNSNNANSLFEVCSYDIKYFISNVEEALNLNLRENDKIIIVGSASTPKSLLNEIRDQIKNKYIK